MGLWTPGSYTWESGRQSSYHRLSPAHRCRPHSHCRCHTSTGRGCSGRSCRRTGRPGTASRCQGYSACCRPGTSGPPTGTGTRHHWVLRRVNRTGRGARRTERKNPIRIVRKQNKMWNGITQTQLRNSITLAVGRKPLRPDIGFEHSTELHGTSVGTV